MQPESTPDSTLNAADQNPPSRPNPIVTTGFLVVLAGVLLYINWHGAKGFLGFE